MMSGHAMRRRLEAKRFAVRKGGRVDLKRQSLCRCVLLFTERAAQVRGKGPCGSLSIRRTFVPAALRAEPRFNAVIAGIQIFNELLLEVFYRKTPHLLDKNFTILVYQMG